jgi:hypothetical protein
MNEIYSALYVLGLICSIASCPQEMDEMPMLLPKKVNYTSETLVFEMIRPHLRKVVHAILALEGTPEGTYATSIRARKCYQESS